MSQKINSKNLSYDTTLPPFLAAMRAQAGGGDTEPTIGRRQLGKKRSDSEEAEDAPLVLDEDGNVVSVDIDNDGTVTRKEGDDDVADEEKAVRDGEAASEGASKSATAIGGRKRKVGKVIGDAGDDAATETKADKKGKKDTQDKDDQPKEKKAKKKAKKIKLSFDEDDG